jgi:transcriptional regulator with XRE-family HTH domain
MDLQKKLGNRIRELRKKRKMTQALLAEKTDLSDNFIGLLERGQTTPSLETLDKISKALKVPIRELFEFETESVVGKERMINELNRMLKEKNGADVRWFHSISMLLMEKMTRQ